MMKSVPWLSLSMLVSCLPILSAGVIYEMETTEAGADTAKVMEVRAQDDRLKMTFEGDTSEREFVIYDGGNKTLMVASPSERSYYVLDNAQLTRLSEAISAAQKQMEQALAQVPEGQRERMRQMMQGGMAGMMGGGPAPEIEVERTDETRKIGGYPTTQYIVKTDGQRTTELWVTPWENINGSEEVRETLQGMTRFFTGLLEAMPQMAQGDNARSNWMRAMDEIDGFPVESRTFDPGRDVATETTTLKSVRSENLDAGDFAPPEDFTRRSLDLPNF